MYIHPRKGKDSDFILQLHAYATQLVESIKLINVYDPSRNKTPLDFIHFTWLSCGVQYIHKFIHLFSRILSNKSLEDNKNYVALLLSLYTMTPFWIRSGISTANHGPNCNKIRSYDIHKMIYITS